MSLEDPKCPHCGQSSCVVCRASASHQRLRAIMAELPPLSDEERDRYHAHARPLSLWLSTQQLVIGIALRELKRLATGRSALCSKHLLSVAGEPPEPAATDEALSSTGFVRHLAANDAAVTRHTLARFARLWEELRPALPPVLVTRSDVASVVKELDVLTSEVLG